MLKIAVLMPSTVEDAGDFLANIRALEAAGAEMIGVEGGATERLILLGAIAAVTERVRIMTTGSEPDVIRALGRGRAERTMEPGESWVEVPVPRDRESWTVTLREQEAAGTTGVIVPWEPRLIDLLRNPEPDDRSDLQMSTG
jgi:hypothetical protein